MTTLMSSGFRVRAWVKFSGRSRFVMSRASQARSARAKGFSGLVPVPLVGVDTSEHHVVFQHRCSCDDPPWRSWAQHRHARHP